MKHVLQTPFLISLFFFILISNAYPQSLFTIGQSVFLYQLHRNALLSLNQKSTPTTISMYTLLFEDTAQETLSSVPARVSYDGEPELQEGVIDWSGSGLKLIHYGGDSKTDTTGNQSSDQEKQSTNKQGNTSSESTNTASDSGSQPVGTQSVSNAITQLQGLKDSISSQRKEEDQTLNIARFHELLERLAQQHPEIAKLFQKSHSELTRKVSHTGMWKALEREFPEEMATGKIKHIALIPDTSANTPLFREYLSYVRQPGPLTYTHLIAINTLLSLAEFFIEELPFLEDGIERLYVIQLQNAHVTLLNIQKIESTGKLSVKILDSANAFMFTHPEQTQTFSPVSELSALALMLAMENDNTVAGGNFYTFPASRQTDQYSCSAFVIHDIHVLLNASDSGSQYSFSGAHSFQLGIWSPVIVSALERRGALKVSNSDWKPQLTMLDPVQFDDLLWRHTKKRNTLTYFTSIKYTFHKLRTFPIEHLQYVQHKRNLKALTEHLGPEDQEKTKEVYQQGLGLVVTGGQYNDGQYAAEENFYAPLAFMKLVVDLLQASSQFISPSQHDQNNPVSGVNDTESAL